MPCSEQSSLGTAGPRAAEPTGLEEGETKLSLLREAGHWQSRGREADECPPSAPAQGKGPSPHSSCSARPAAGYLPALVKAAPLFTSSSARIQNWSHHSCAPMHSNASMGNFSLQFCLVRTQEWTAPLPRAANHPGCPKAPPRAQMRTAL